MGVIQFALAMLLAADPVSFEVASVKVHDAPGGTIQLTTTGPNLLAEAEPLTNLITYSWNIAPYQLVDSPAMHPFGDTFFDISAKAADTHIPSTDEFRLLMRSLLAERFHLRTHSEMRELPVYALTIDPRRGKRFEESTAAPDAKPSYTSVDRNYQVLLPRARIADLIRLIDSSLLDRPVFDETGLTAQYTMQLTYTLNTRAHRLNPDPDDVSIFTAVEKLGLKLTPVKRAMQVLVVDSVSSPTTN